MRSLFLRLRAPHVLTLLVAYGLGSGCAASSSKDTATLQASVDSGLNQVRVTVVDSGVRDSGARFDGGLNARCGTTDYCKGRTPDDALACADFDAGFSAPTPASDAGARGDARRERDGGAPEAAPGHVAKRPTDAGVADAARDGGDASAGDASLPIPAPMEPPADAGQTYACQIGRDDSGFPVHKCVLSGTGAAGSPCASVRSCGPGLGCVGPATTDVGLQGAATTGLCTPYCCEGGEHCAPGTFCAERPLLDGTTKAPLMVPVCAVGDPCTLLEPFPCTVTACSCPSDMTCAIVRGDGTMGCVTPGTGKVGEPCPCAAGYYCSVATSACVKMCKTDGIDPRCAPGKCQAEANFPQGFGLCVGYTPSVQ